MWILENLQPANRADWRLKLVAIGGGTLVANHFCPLRFALRAFNRGNDKSHSAKPVLDGRKIGILWKLSAAHFCGNGSSGSQIHIGEGFDKRFRMPEWRTSIFSSGLANVVVSASKNLSRLVVILNDQLIGVFLVPLQRSLGPVHANVKIVLVAVGNLRCIEDAFGAPFITNQNITIVIELATRHEGS